MAFKDAINKMVSYFDTDEVNEVEEEVTAAKMEEPVVQEPKQRPIPSQQTSRQSQNPAMNRPTVARSQQTESDSLPTYPNRQESIDRRSSGRESVTASTARRETYQAQTTVQEGKTTIPLKYPKKYEDAQEIVDLLIGNECVLIDFQFMLDAQARRCLDFIDGASKVLYGTLQKVGSSMYLLTPSNVSVNIEDMNIPNHNQDFGYDFDMKRR